MIPSWLATNHVLPFGLKNVSQGQRLQKLLSQLLYKRSLPNFHGNDGNVAGNKNVIFADLQIVGQGKILLELSH